MKVLDDTENRDMMTITIFWNRVSQRELVARVLNCCIVENDFELLSRNFPFQTNTIGKGMNF